MLKIIKGLNKKGFTLVEILLAIGLTTVASVGVGGMVLSTQENSAKMLSESELQQQVTEVQETFHNDLITTSAGIKYWVKTGSNSYEHSYGTASETDSSEKIIALYNLDQADYLMTKTYYRYNGEKKTLEKAELTQAIDKLTDRKQEIAVDENIGSTINDIENGPGWTLIATDMEYFNVDLSQYKALSKRGEEKKKLVNFEMEVKTDNHSYPTDDTLYIRNEIKVNENPVVDKYHTIKLPKPYLEDDLHTYDAQEHGPRIINYDTKIARYILKEAESVTAATNAGTYMIKFSIKNTETVKWEDGSVNPVVLTWKINPRVVELHWGQTEFDYDGQRHQTTCQATNVVQGDNCQLVLLDNNVGPAAGSQTVTAQVDNPNYALPAVYKQLIKIVAAEPTATINKVDRTYNGSAQSMVSTSNVVGGVVKYYISTSDATPNPDLTSTSCTATNAGTYHIWYQIIAQDDNYTTTDVKYLGVATMARAKTAAYTVKNPVYNGSAQTGVSGSYVNISGTYSATNAGTYTAKVTPDANHAWSDGTTATKTVTWQITKAQTQITAPTAKSLTYNGGYQKLVNAGSTPYGTMMYKCDGDWSTSIPTGLNAGTYKVYYYSTGDANHEPSDQSKYVTVTIARQKSAAATAKNSTYNGTKLSGVASLTQAYVSSGTSSAINVGTYEFVVTAKENYAFADGSTSKTLSWKINKATTSVTAPTAKDLTYTGSAQTLINKGSATYGTMQYKLEGGSWSTALPTGTNAGEYKVYYYATGDANHAASDQSKYITVTIKRKPSATASGSEVMWTGAELSGVTGANVTWSGTTKATAVGSYTAKATPTANYAWSDGTYATKDVAWTIVKKNDATYTKTDRTYTGSEQTGVTGKNVTLSGTTKATAAGSYTAYAVPIDGHCWEDFTTAKKTIAWKIAQKTGTVTTKPTAKTLTYNGSAQTLINAGAGNGTMYYKLSGGSYSTSLPTATNAGSYTVYYYSAATTNYTQSAEGSLTVTIARAKSASYTKTDRTYNGSAQTGLTVTNATRTGTYSATAAGTYTAYAEPTANYAWSDGTYAKKTISWTISRATSATASAANKTYSGSSQTGVTGSNVDWTGTTSATAAGSYTAYATPTANYAWSDGTTAKKTVTWTMARAKTATASASNKTWSGSAQTGVTGTYVASWSGTTSATAAGSYSATATADSNHLFSDGATTKTVSWSIARAKTATCSSVGTVKRGTSAQNGYKGNAYVTFGGTYSAAGSAQVKSTYTFTATPDSNHAWSDGSTAAKSFTWYTVPWDINVGDKVKAKDGGANKYSNASDARNAKNALSSKNSAGDVRYVRWTHTGSTKYTSGGWAYDSNAVALALASSKSGDVLNWGRISQWYDVTG